MSFQLFVYSNLSVFKGVLVLQVSWVFAQLKSSALSGFDQESVVLSNDGPDDGLRHIFCCSKLLKNGKNGYNCSKCVFIRCQFSVECFVILIC